MNKNRVLFLSKLFLILILTGNITLTAQDGESPKSGGCGGKSKTNANVSKSETDISKPNTNVSGTSANDLDARRWNLIEINGGGVESSKAFVEFVSAEKRFAGNAGCNRMFGSVEMNGNDIKFSKIGTTKMFCSQEGVMKLESDFIKALENTTRFEQTGDTLNLYAGSNLALKFSGAAKNTNSNSNSGSDNSGSENSSVVKLEDKRWILTAIAGKPLPKIKTAPFLVFDKQKQSAGGDSGCNSFGGSYKTEANKISFIEIIATLRACIEDERMNVEREFLGGLQKANRFDFKAGKLNLYEGDKLLLTFDAAAKS